MPWFAVDDGFPTHPKVRKAGNAAAGLFTKLGAHCAKHLTDGYIDGVTARDYGTLAQIRKLIAVGMLHEHGHTCPKEWCIQPAEGDYVMHDYLDYNRRRSQIEKARESGRKRQQKGRAKQAEERAETKTEAQPDLTRTSPEPQVNLGWDSNDPQNEARFDSSAAGQGDTSRRDTLQGATVVPSQPLPSPLLPSEEELASPARETEHSGVPPALQPLANALHHAGLVGLGWDLRGDEPFRIEALLKAKGLPAMVQRAKTAAENSTKPVGHVRYFLGKPGCGGPWLELPTITAEPGPPVLRAVSGDSRPTSTADKRVVEGAALVELFAQREAQEGQA